MCARLSITVEAESRVELDGDIVEISERGDVGAEARKSPSVGTGEEEDWGAEERLPLWIARDGLFCFGKRLVASLAIYISLLPHCRLEPLARDCLTFAALQPLGRLALISPRLASPPHSEVNDHTIPLICIFPPLPLLQIILSSHEHALTT